jgi:hypothetical protein
MPGLAHELVSCVKLSLYCIVGNLGRAQNTLLGQNRMGILRPNFHLLRKRINY